ncbi:hypothetical protein [Gayadomonas joobiniege]|uniref:hypothetical protein n=1 Tax=Gayadomonas joobiniege TaxID=1234606 RepID=UPI0003673C63|nr:hypothetical protein [Gayadomonas joobiniege]
MTTQYTHRITLAVPESLLDVANHLALLAGESPSDINTFTNLSYQDESGNLYAVCSAVSKPIVPMMLENGLMVVEKEGVDMTKAQAALDEIHAGNIKLAVDLPPLEAFKTWGLEKIPDLEETI